MHEALQNLKAIVPLLFSILHVIIIMSDPRLEDDLIRRSYFRSLEREKKEDVETEIKATKHLMSGNMKYKVKAKIDYVKCGIKNVCSNVYKSIKQEF